MKTTSCRSLAIGAGLVAAAALVSPAQSSPIEIAFTGLDVVYDGSTLHDAGSIDGGVGDPAEADPLTTVAFSIDGTLVGPVITEDASIDIDISDLAIELPDTIPGSSTATSTSTGVIDLLIGDSAPAFALALDVDDVAVTFIDTGIAEFVFGSSVTSDIFEQDLPFGLIIGTPVVVSFSANVVDGTLSDDGDFITGFEAFGTGEITGPFIPEPSAFSIAALALLAAGAARRRQAAGGWGRSRRRSSQRPLGSSPKR